MKENDINSKVQAPIKEQLGWRADRPIENGVIKKEKSAGCVPKGERVERG